MGTESQPVSGEQFMNMLSETVPFYSDSNSQRTEDNSVGMGTTPADGPEQPPLLAGDYLVAQPRKVRRKKERERDWQNTYPCVSRFLRYILTTQSKPKDWMWRNSKEQCGMLCQEFPLKSSPLRYYFLVHFSTLLIRIVTRRWEVPSPQIQ